MREEITDTELLRRYAGEKSETAFAELVNRHINLVYAGALRRVGGDAHLAKDVTQQVFTALASAAAKVSRHPALTAWLHTTTRFAATRMVRAERRRHVREQEAHLMHESSLADSPNAADWERLRPLLDEVLDELNESDREAVLLRYLEGQSFAELGRRLQLTENTARMRVDRALDKMNGLLARRGVTSPVAALGAALASQTAVVAPAGLAATVTGAALSGAAALTGSAGALAILSFMNAKIIVGTAGIVTALAIGTVFYQAKINRETLATVGRERAQALARVHGLETELAVAKTKAEAADKDSGVMLGVLDQLQETKAVATPEVPVTHDVVQARYKQAQELARSGSWAEALKEFLWCYDEGMVRVSSFGGVRSSFLLGEIVKMAANYPPALAALRERRDAAGQRMLASGTDSQAAMDFASLNRNLGEQARTLAVFDQLAVDDSRRRTLLALGGFSEQLIAAQRYGDVAQVRTYSQMNQSFALTSTDRPLPAGIPASVVETQKAMLRTRIVTTTANDIEVLAGAGQLDQARELATKLIKYDDSAETRNVIQERLVRAGQPGLLANP